MGHMIRAVIAKESIICGIAEKWKNAEKHSLPQGYALTLLSDDLFDEIEGSFDEKGGDRYPQFRFLSCAVEGFLKRESEGAELIYIETDYFGGKGTQSGVIFADGEMITEPKQGEGTINSLLRKIGVRRDWGKDEFDSVELFRFRRMDM